MLLSQQDFDDYRIEQVGMQFRISIRSQGSPQRGEDAVALELRQLCFNLGLQAPTMAFANGEESPQHNKRRRIRCLKKPTTAAACGMSLQEA